MAFKFSSFNTPQSSPTPAAGLSPARRVVRTGLMPRCHVPGGAARPGTFTRAFHLNRTVPARTPVRLFSGHQLPLCPRVRSRARWLPASAGDSGTDGAELEGRDSGDEGEEKRDEGGLGSQGEGSEEEELLRALNLDPAIPESSTQFLAKVSSSAYDMRRRLELTLQATTFDVVESNPWRREEGKSVFVLAKEDEQLFTMRTRRPRQEVEHELDLLFFRGRQGRQGWASYGQAGSSSSSSNSSTGSQSLRDTGSSSNSSAVRSQRFRMQVEDIREGVLVFEDEGDAAQYCRVLGASEPGSECVGVAQFQATELFQVCAKSKALAVVFKRGCVPPSPEFLRHTLKARKQSLEEDL